MGTELTHLARRAAAHFRAHPAEAAAAVRAWEVNAARICAALGANVADHPATFVIRLAARLAGRPPARIRTSDWLARQAPAGMNPEMTERSIISHLRRLREAAIDHDYADEVIRRLAATGSGHPGQIAQCVEIMTRGSTEQYFALLNQVQRAATGRTTNDAP